MIKGEKNLTVGIVGLGLIGGSFGRAILQKTPHRVFGCARSAEAVNAAIVAGAVTGELTDAVLPKLDLLIFAVNPRMVERILPGYLPLLKDGCIVTDVSGTKRGIVSVMRTAAEQYPKLRFIGAHPMAGKELSGFAHSTATLFENASVLLVPVNADDAAVSALTKLFFELGFKNCKVTTAEEHDKIIAYTSQACHVISSAYCQNSLYPLREGFTAGSFRDLTRVARLDADMWTELFMDNADNLTAVLDEFTAQVSELRNAIAARNERKVHDILAAGNERKKS